MILRLLFLLTFYVIAVPFSYGHSIGGKLQSVYTNIFAVLETYSKENSGAVATSWDDLEVYEIKEHFQDEMDEPIEDVVSFLGGGELPNINGREIIAVINIPFEENTYYTVALDSKGDMLKVSHTKNEIKSAGINIPEIDSALGRINHTHEHEEKFINGETTDKKSPPQSEEVVINPSLDKGKVNQTQQTKKEEDKERHSGEPASTVEQEKPISFPWWIIGLVVLLAIVFFMLKGKSKR